MSIIRSRAFVPGVALFIILLIAAGIVYAEVSTRSGSAAISRVDYVEVHEDQFSTPVTCSTSTIYEDIPGMTKTFSQGGIVANEVFIEYLSQVESPARPQEAYIRLLIDGVPQSGSGEGVALKSGMINTEQNSWNFISDPITPGVHTATLQWKVSDQDYCISSRSMTILHR